MGNVEPKNASNAILLRSDVSLNVELLFHALSKFGCATSTVTGPTLQPRRMSHARRFLIVNVPMVFHRTIVVFQVRRSPLAAG